MESVGTASRKAGTGGKLCCMPNHNTACGKYHQARRTASTEAIWPKVGIPLMCARRSASARDSGTRNNETKRNDNWEYRYVRSAAGLRCMVRRGFASENFDGGLVC